MTDYGTDINVLLPGAVQGTYYLGLDPTFALVSGTRLLAQDALKRVTTPPGSIEGADTYDLRSWQNREILPGDESVASTRATQAILEDERLSAGRCDVTFDPGTGKVSAKITLTPIGGKAFDLVLQLSLDAIPMIIMGHL